MKFSKLLLSSVLLVVLMFAGIGQVLAAQNLLANPTFMYAQGETLPTSWKLYGHLEDGNAIKVANANNPAQRALHFIDASQERQVGVYQVVPGRAGDVYTLSALVKAVPGASMAGGNIQMRFMPAGERINVALSPYLEQATSEFVEVAVSAVAPDGTTSINVYIWAGLGSTTEFLVKEISLVREDI